MKLPDRRYIVWGLGLAVTAALPLFAGFAGFGWELSETFGLAAVLACLALSGCPVRPRDSMPPTLLSLRRHEVLGLLALGLAALHVLLALLADHKVIEYLKFTSPLYQMAGIAAFILLLALAATSLETQRRRLWRSHRNFQATHIIIGCLLVPLIAAHVITANRYTGSNGRRAAFILAAAGMALLLQRRRPQKAPTQEGASVRRNVFGRHSTLTVGVIATALLALLALAVSRAGIALREPVLRRSEALPLNFDHGKHNAVNCLACHHNYADGRGFDGCIHCHSGTRTDLKVGIEARFHDFCLNCHRHPAPEFQRHGPVSGCTTCHQQPAGAQNSGPDPAATGSRDP
jgi:DMSO/TMAO reductase YedYZ heme-binding membrane subunit